jgi:hypothetical protein
MFFSLSTTPLPLTPDFVAGSGKSVLWFVISAIIVCVDSDFRPALG